MVKRLEDTPERIAARARYNKWYAKAKLDPVQQEKFKEKRRKANHQWPAKRALGLEIENLKATTPCKDCSTIYPAVCMDFDHLPGSTKAYAVATMVAHGHNREAVFEEIAKCELVCSNCHRIRTQKRKKKSQDS